MKLATTCAAAAIGAALLAASPAVATDSAYTVSVGGSAATATHPFTAATTGTTMLKVPTFHTGCSSGWVPSSPLSTVTSGEGVMDVLTVNKVQLTGCSSFGGSLAFSMSGPWAFHGTSPATSGTSDLITGHITGLTATWSNAVCKFTVAGTADASFDESTQRLAIAETGFTGDLVVSNVTGCLSQFQNGQPFDFTATFTVSSPDGLINLS